MISVSTFYLSRIIGRNIYSESDKPIGKILDMIVNVSDIRPRVIALRVRTSNEAKNIDFSNVAILKKNGQYYFQCSKILEIELPGENILFLAKNVLDRQLVDMDGKKIVRVNDIRLAILSSGTYTVAVDVGAEGFLRRLGVAKPLKKVIKPFRLNIPSKLVLWDEVAAIDSAHSGIKLSKEHAKLSTLHPSDLADIIEDLDRIAQAAVFASLDDEKAADVLEELEPDAQISILESLTLEKAAEMLEKMPADEAADILEELEDDKAEELLNIMESEASEEIRELMEYPEHTVGSLMSTDYVSLNENMTIEETLSELRKMKPESDNIYYLYVLSNNENLVATVSLRDIVVSEPQTKLSEIMDREVIYMYDSDKIDKLNENISKYSLLAMPVVDHDMKMLGMVIIDDVVQNLLKSRRKRM